MVWEHVGGQCFMVWEAEARNQKTEVGGADGKSQKQWTMLSDGVNREGAVQCARGGRNNGTEIAGGVVKILFRPKLPGSQFHIPCSLLSRPPL